LKIMDGLLLDKARAYIRVYGKVQGVSYRFFSKHHARRLRLKGYGRNLSDGSVGAVVEGDRIRIEELIEKLRNGCYWLKLKE